MPNSAPLERYETDIERIREDWSAYLRTRQDDALARDVNRWNKFNDWRRQQRLRLVRFGHFRRALMISGSKLTGQLLPGIEEHDDSMP